MPPDLTPEERRLRARMASHAKWAQVRDPAAATTPARKAFMRRFEIEVDPNGVLPPEERARRAEHALKSHMARLALKSSKARRARKAKKASS
ncbi:MAG TPA: hypothetical protein VM848_15455 [Acidimicrobiia bacterium]|nr:hypothetical protein [Acidimicrobiia bacterium]